MNKWEEILNKFLEPYKNDDKILGAILGGSYANNNYNESSDIDISIITIDENYNKRGNVIIDGIMIEYFINSINGLRKYMDDEFNNRHMLATANLIGNGKIIFKKSDTILELQKEAKYYYNKEFPSPNETKIMCKKYACFDSYDELKTKVKNNESYSLNYFVLLQTLIDLYYYSNNIATIPITKVEKIYRDNEYSKKYNLKNEPCADFKNMVLECIDKMSIDSIDRLYNYVMGDFSITDFNLENF